MYIVLWYVHCTPCSQTSNAPNINFPSYFFNFYLFCKSLYRFIFTGPFHHYSYFSLSFYFLWGPLSFHFLQRPLSFPLSFPFSQTLSLPFFIFYSLAGFFFPDTFILLFLFFLSFPLAGFFFPEIFILSFLQSPFFFPLCKALFLLCLFSFFFSRTLDSFLFHFPF